MKECIYIFVWFTYGWISVVDDLSHEVSEEDGLSDDGEPGEQVTGTQSQQLRRHLQHGEPQQPHGGLNLKRGDRFGRYPTKKYKLHTARKCVLTSPSSLSVSPLEELVFPLRCLFLCLLLLLCLASTSYRSFMLRDGLMRKAALARR